MLVVLVTLRLVLVLLLVLVLRNRCSMNSTQVKGEWQLTGNPSRWNQHSRCKTTQMLAAPGSRLLRSTTANVNVSKASPQTHR